MEARGDLDLSMMSEGSVKTETEEVKEAVADAEDEVEAQEEPAAVDEPAQEEPAAAEAVVEVEEESEAALEDKLASEEADGNFGHLDQQAEEPEAAE